MKNNLKWTGERMVDDIFLAKGIVEHLHRYAVSLEFVNDKVILDIACGEGYGSNLLSQSAKKVYGIDISDIAITHASEKYNKDNITFLEGSVLNIPLEDNLIDTIVSFETLEHLTEQEIMLKEFKRVLKPDGILIISTPEKENYHEVDPNNPYHLKELTYNEFKLLLSSHFSNVKIAQQKFLFSSQIINSNNKIDEWVEYSGSFEKISKKSFLGGHYFNIAICSSNTNDVCIGSSIFNGNALFKKWEETVTDLPRIISNQMKRKPTYKIASYIVAPFRLLKRIFKK